MTANLPLPPKPPVPSTNLAPAIAIVAVVALACLALAVWMPPPRRPAPTPQVAQQPAPMPLPPLAATPITEYEDTSAAILPTPTTLPTPTVTTAVTPRWQLNAQPAPVVPAGYARLAIIIDDMGKDVSNTHVAMDILPSAVTFAFLPYAANVTALARQAHAHGHEVMVHIPMEPLPRSDGSETPDPGPNALTVEQTEPHITANLTRNLIPLVDLAVGANNHMGSRFTQWPTGMRTVLQHLDREGLFFLDSVTTAHTATHTAAAGLSLPILRRNVFLDDQPEPHIVQSQLDRAIALARRNGNAIVIGHPHPSTLAVLAERLPTLAAEHVTLVPVTALIPDAQ